MSAKSSRINQKREVAKTEIGVIARGEQSIQLHAGPLPDAETFARYDQILPGAADRILRMAENEQNARHKAQEKFFTDLKCLRNYTLIHALAICGVAFFAIYRDYPIASGVLVALAIVGGWIGGQRRANRNKTEE